MMSDEPMYDEWIAGRRAVEPSRDLSDRIVAALDRREGDVQPTRYVRLADRINDSQLARWAACVTALMVGSLPFLFGAYLAQALAF